MLNAWWGILPPFEADDDWFDIQTGDRLKVSNKTYPSYRVELPEFYTKDDLDKKYKEGVKAGKAEADGAYEKGYAAGKADTQKKVDEAYNHGYEDAAQLHDDDKKIDFEALNDGFTRCSNLITNFLRLIWNAEDDVFEALRDKYCERHPKADEDEVCIEDIMEDVINGEVPIDEMLLAYNYYNIRNIEDQKSAINEFDIVLAPDGSKVVIYDINDNKYSGFYLNSFKKVSGTLDSVKKIGRMRSEEDI